MTAKNPHVTPPIVTSRNSARYEMKAGLGLFTEILTFRCMLILLLRRCKVRIIGNR